jgi:hypothetical protein
MKALILAIALATGMAAPPADAAWRYPSPQFDMQAQKGRQGGGQERAQEREARPNRRDEREDRRERMNDDERRALHRDLDKANRELYQPRRFR